MLIDGNSVQERNSIFISHATPEDNDFTIWLASRLQADGYNVWIDKQALLGGEKFWQEIDQVIRHKARKFLMVYSEDICSQKKRGILRDGIEKEKSLAESIAKASDIKDFIILLNIDKSEYNLFIGADTLNQIPFHENWAVGYAQLIKKLKKDGVEPSTMNVGNFSEWYENEYLISSGIKDLQEIYYDSWWPIPNLPQYLFVYMFDNESISTQIQQHSKYPATRIANIIVTFHDTSEFELVVNDNTQKINFSNKYAIRVSDILSKEYRGDYPSARDVDNYLKSLLQRIFHIIMRERGLWWHNMANKKQAYYFTHKSNSKIHFHYSLRNKKINKKKALYGKYQASFWHFALSGKPILSPQIAFGLKSHIVFTTDGFNLWEDKDKMHSARRRKGRLLFNKEWRDLLFAFLHALCREKPSIKTRLSPSFVLSLPPWTNIYKSNFGYYEPKEKDRHNILEGEYGYYERDDEPEETEEVIDG